MSYATVQDMTNRYPNRDLVQLTNEDPTLTTIDTAVIQRSLDDASAEIDSYIAGRFTLPMADPPAALIRVATDVAIYRLQALRPLHDLAEARERYNDAIAMLAKVARGELTLGIGVSGSEPALAGAVEAVEGPDRVFKRGSLKGY